MKDQPRVLYLARWYPNRYDPMPGLFIQRHAEAASTCCRVGVVYCHATQDKNVKGLDMDFALENGVPTARIYYRNPENNVPVISFVSKTFRFLRANRKGMQKIRDELGGVDLIHVHILTRLGVIALWYKWFDGVPYIISEHWSRYLQLTGDFRGGLRKWFTRLVVRNAEIVTTVTKNLALAMQRHGLKNKQYSVLHNVVSDSFLQVDVAAKKRDTGVKKLVHVSCFEDRSKNVSGLLRVVGKLAAERKDFIFQMIGEGIDFDEMRDYARRLDIPEGQLVFSGLLEGNALAGEMATSDLLVIFSHYENLPVVINESFALGVPVVATAVGGIPELVDESNGFLIQAGNEPQLEKALNDFLDGKLRFDNESIRMKNRKRFSPEVLGKELCGIYQQILDK